MFWKKNNPYCNPHTGKQIENIKVIEITIQKELGKRLISEQTKNLLLNKQAGATVYQKHRTMPNKK